MLTWSLSRQIYEKRLNLTGRWENSRLPSYKMAKTPEFIHVAPGVELNFGYMEDSDSVVVIAPTTLLKAGEQKNGAIPVRIVENGKPSEEIFFYHQPDLLE